MSLDSNKVCATCGHVGEPDQHTPGSILIELVLWLCLLVPGLIYSFWRISARRDVCSQCGGSNLLPLDSPVGRALADKHRVAVDTLPLPFSTPPRPPSKAAYGIGRALGRLFKPR